LNLFTLFNKLIVTPNKTLLICSFVCKEICRVVINYFAGTLEIFTDLK